MYSFHLFTNKHTAMWHTKVHTHTLTHKIKKHTHPTSFTQTHTQSHPHTLKHIHTHQIQKKNTLTLSFIHTLTHQIQKHTLIFPFPWILSVVFVFVGFCCCFWRMFLCMIFCVYMQGVYIHDINNKIYMYWCSNVCIYVEKICLYVSLYKNVNKTVLKNPQKKYTHYTSFTQTITTHTLTQNTHIQYTTHNPHVYTHA